MLKPHTKLVFKDDFKTFNRVMWNVEVGDKWHNDERQCYVDSANHIQITDQGLSIIATVDPSKQHCRYQSARLNTRNKQMWQYGTLKCAPNYHKAKGLGLRFGF